MKMKSENYDHVTVISCAGDVTTDDLEPLKKLVSERLENGGRDFVLELNETEFIDSMTLETLLWIQEQADERLGQLRLAGPTENVRRILHVTRLEHHFDTHTDVETALKSLR
ncbi:MAG: STAS domain-containing protein [Phycisphaeraceae bacterium]